MFVKILYFLPNSLTIKRENWCLLQSYLIQNNIYGQNYFVNSRDKCQILEVLGIAVDAFGTLFGSSNAYKIQKLRGILQVSTPIVVTDSRV